MSELKFDRRFIHNVGTSHNTAALVRALIRLGQSLQVHVVAEGVEDEHTAVFLLQHGCENAQGFFYSQPIDPEGFANTYFQPVRQSRP